MQPNFMSTNSKCQRCQLLCYTTTSLPPKDKHKYPLCRTTQSKYQYVRRIAVCCRNIVPPRCTKRIHYWWKLRAISYDSSKNIQYLVYLPIEQSHRFFERSHAVRKPPHSRSVLQDLCIMHAKKRKLFNRKKNDNKWLKKWCLPSQLHVRMKPVSWQRLPKQSELL